MNGFQRFGVHLNAFLRTEQRFSLSDSSRFRCYNQWRVLRVNGSYVSTGEEQRKKRIVKSIDFRKTKLELKETKNILKERFDGINENVTTLPNALCLLRIGLTPVLGHFVLMNEYQLAFVVFSIAGLTDLLDGYIARKFPNQKSVFGSFLDPFADKFLIATLFATLTYTGLIPLPLTALIVVRDVALVAAASYIRYQSLPSPKSLSKYFDVKYATVQMSPTMISKVNTALQLSVVASTLGACLTGLTDHPLLHLLLWTTAGTTVASGLSYLLCNNTYKFIRNNPRHLCKS